MFGNPSENAGAIKVTLPKAYKKYFLYIEQEQHKKYRDGVWTGDNYEPLNHYYLLPGISISEEDNNEQIEVSINQSTLPSDLKFGQDTLLNAIHSLKSISELSDNSAANKEKMAATLQSALKRYLLPHSNKSEHFAKRIYGHGFSLLLTGAVLSPITGPALMLDTLVGIITGAIHHSFSWNRRMRGVHEAFVAAVETTKQQISSLSPNSSNSSNSSFGILSYREEEKQILHRSPNYEVIPSCPEVDGGSIGARSRTLFFPPPKELEERSSAKAPQKSFG